MAIVISELPNVAAMNEQVVGTEKTLRSAAVLTLSYVPCTNDIQCDRANAFRLAFTFTLGASTGMTFKLETSSDGGTTWVEKSIYQNATKKIDLFEATIDATATREIVVTKSSELMRVSVKALTDATNTSLAVAARGVFSPVGGLSL